MRRYETITRPATTEERLLEVVCNVCGRPSPHRDTWRGVNWSESSFGYEFDRVTISRKTGNCYPDCDLEIESSEVYDLCNKCWAEILVPFLQSKGIEPNDPADTTLD